MDVKSTEKKSKKNEKRSVDDALTTADQKPAMKTKKKNITSSDNTETESDTRPATPTRCYNKKNQKPEEGSFNVMEGPTYCYFLAII